MRWVNETLPPRARARWLLMTVRLSHSSLTGTERTDVAVGHATARRPCWPRCARGRRAARCRSARRSAGDGRGGLGVLGDRGAWCPWPARRRRPSGAASTWRPWPGVRAREPSRPGREPSAGPRGAFAGACGCGPGPWPAPAAAAWVWRLWAGALRGRGGRAAGRCGLPLPKYAAHSGPTLPGSLSYCSFISSTSHSLAPRSDDGATEDWLPDCPFGDCATLVSPLPDRHRARYGPSR